MATVSDFHFYSTLFSELNTALTGYVSSTATNVIAQIAPVAITLVTIYVMLWGWSMMRGVISEPIMDGIGRIVRLSLIMAIALQLGYYNGFLADLLWNSPDALASIVAGTSAVTTTSFLDTLMSQMYDLGDAFYQKAWANSTIGIPDLGLLMTACAVWVAGVLATGYGAFLLALAKMGLAICLGVGPIFVLMTVFEPTKKFFDAWLGQALNYVFMAMLAVATIKLILVILQTYLLAATDVYVDPNLNQAIPAIAFALVGVLVLVQMPAMASALGGGVALNTLGAVGWTYAKARGAAGGTWHVASGRTLSDMRAVRRSKEMNARWAARNPGLASRSVGAPMAVYRKITNRVSRTSS